VELTTPHLNEPTYYETLHRTSGLDLERKIRWAGYIARMGKMRNAYKILVGKSEKKRQLRGSGSRWEDCIRVGLWEIRWEVVEWMHLAPNRDQWRAVVNTVMDHRFL
jgi:hypothetical protein